MNLFIENKNNCASIVTYQFIQASKLTYQQFKDMVNKISHNRKEDMNVLKYIEPVVKKYWNEKDFHKYPEYDNPKKFSRNCDLEWGKINSSKSIMFSNIDNEYTCLDFFVRLLLRVITFIDLESKYYKKNLKEFWMTDMFHGLEPLMWYAYAKSQTEHIEKYCDYMKKYTDTIPLISYELVFTDNKHYDYHAICIIKKDSHKYIDLNSNLKKKVVEYYTPLCIRDTKKDWKREPKKKIIEQIYEKNDLEDVGKMMFK